MFGDGPSSHLDLVDDETIDALSADRRRSISKEHLRLSYDPGKSASQGGKSLELTELFIPRSDRAGGKFLLADLAKLQARRPYRPLEVGDLEIDHFMAP